MTRWWWRRLARRHVTHIGPCPRRHGRYDTEVYWSAFCSVCGQLDPDGCTSYPESLSGHELHAVEVLTAYELARGVLRGKR